MLLYRITRKPFANDLSGTGSRIFGGRWNSIGKSLTYLAGSPSLSVLEVLVHIPAAGIPDDYMMITLDVPEDITALNTEKLPKDWADIYPPLILRNYGDDFIAENKTLLLKVPSAIVKQEYNYLLNPGNPKMAKVKIAGVEPFSFDKRLM